jgi:hypothetical protein
MDKKTILFTPTLSQLLDRYKDKYEYPDMDIPVSTTLLERLFNEINSLQSQVNALKGGSVSWARYDDTQYTAGSPYTLNQDAETVIPNNAGFKIETYLDSSVPYYDPGPLRTYVEQEGDTYMTTIAFKMKSTNANQTYVEVFLASSGPTPYRRLIQTFTFPKGNNVEHAEHVVFQYYGDTDFVNNGAQWSAVARGHSAVIYDVIFFTQRIQKYIP